MARLLKRTGKTEVNPDAITDAEQVEKLGEYGLKLGQKVRYYSLEGSTATKKGIISGVAYDGTISVTDDRTGAGRYMTVERIKRK